MKKKLYEEESLKKIVDPKNLDNLVEKLKKDKKSIVSLNGSFDLLHAGHLQIIYEASLQADVLIVLLNSDLSIKKYKSKNRPIIDLKYRLQMISALGFVGYVSWFDDVDPIKVLEKIMPNVHVNGKEYGDNCIESKIVKKNGGKIHLVDKVGDLSTTKILEKIKLCGF